MQRFVNIVEQLNEAVRLIAAGSIAQTRIALILLDNAAEVLIARTARHELQNDEMFRRIYAGAADMPPEERDKFIKEFGRRVLTKNQRRKVEFDFDARTNYLVEHGHLDRGMADVLIGLHLHRNDTYHRDKIRIPILHATAILYLELCCDLLERLGTQGAYYSSGEDWSKFMAAYGLKDKFFMMNPKELERIVARFRREVGIGRDVLAQILSDYLQSRIEEVEDLLDYLDYYSDRDEALQSIQFTKNHGDAWNKKMALQGFTALKAFEAAKRAFEPTVTSKTMEEWKIAVEELRTSKLPKPGIFAKYRMLELALEPVEEMVREEVAGYEAHIQRAIDHARGK